jgi:hypothetical protein
MSNIITNSVHALGDALTVPFILGVVLALLIGLLRMGSSLKFLLQHRGRRPLVIQVEYGKARLEGGEDYGVLDARLLSYLTADGIGSYVIAPGAGGSAAPAVPAEAVEPSAWLARLAFPQEPAFRINVTWPGPAVSTGELRATVRISRTPGDRIVATQSFAEETTDALVEVIGCFCITFLLRQRRILNCTPRWERWSQDLTGYLAYRRGLAHERNADLTFDADDYRMALGYFHQAARIDPANMLLQLHRASLLELVNDHQEAVSIYKKCRALWPEHIEVAYRLGNAHKSSTSHVQLEELLHPLKDIRERLRFRRLLRSWLLTWRPNHWNPGERRYWWSWLSLKPWDRITKRAAYLNAVALSELAAELSFVLPARNGRVIGSGTTDDAEPPPAARKADVTRLMTRLADVLLYPYDAPATERLLRPERLEVAPPPNRSLISDPAFIPTYRAPHALRRNVGWLALFNAACLFSLAIWIPEEHLPEGFTPDEWRACCARTSILHLGLIHRDPHHRLDPTWLATDPDLQPLRETDIGKLWQGFVGLVPPEAARRPRLKSLRLRRW